ncbi:M23 family metallopeptidase, partial [bacterium]|nr:M23 family metallopeptidase [bacterium]
IGNKYILWITVLLSVAVLQGIAISRDQLMTPKEKPILMVTEDFAFLRQVEPENMKVHPVALVASLEEMREISEMAKPLAVEFDHPEMSFNAEGKAGEKSTQTGEGSHSSISSKSAESQQGSLKSKVKSPKVNPLKNQIKNGEFIYHKVLRGETLSSIVKLYDMTVSQLVLTNGISDPDHIYPGYSLKIAVEKEFFHTVREGDTLWSVSRLYGVGVKLLKTLNGLKEDWLIAGQRIKIRIDDLSQESVQRVILARKTKSRFMWPVTGRVSDQLGWRIHPVTRKRDYHKGVDIAAPKGQKIVASATGKVLYSGASRGYGNLIILQHDGGYTSRYAHCSSLSAKGGETVIQGQVIAKVGATGLATGPHLHFELRKKGKIVDPEDFIGPLPGSYGGRVIARR